MRERKQTTPVLLLSARGQVNERVEGLNAGADDYLPKPFELTELVARVRAMSRRGAESKSTTLRVADLTLDALTRRAQRGGKEIELTAREYVLLEFHALGGPDGRMFIIEKSGITISIQVPTWWMFISAACVKKSTMILNPNCCTRFAAAVIC